jgi:hypothetical protein
MRQKAQPNNIGKAMMSAGVKPAWIAWVITADEAPYTLAQTKKETTTGSEQVIDENEMQTVEKGGRTWRRELRRRERNYKMEIKGLIGLDWEYFRRVRRYLARMQAPLEIESRRRGSQHGELGIRVVVKVANGERF